MRIIKGYRYKISLVQLHGFDIPNTVKIVADSYGDYILVYEAELEEILLLNNIRITDKKFIHHISDDKYHVAVRKKDSKCVYTINMVKYNESGEN